ncbi:MAG: prolipoprotein diacylglyceryl transferase [Oscillospiraceae bacterium]|nr:prolipoprotein diacylglyceryl transferase [Oscillospiraceae bacterium]
MTNIVFFKAFKDGFTVSATALRLFGRDIQWYGVLIAFGFLLAVLFGGRMAYKWKMNLDHMIDVLIGGTVGGILGARAYYVIFHFDLYKDRLADVFKIWEGGLAIYGGLIGGLLAAYLVCRIRKVNYWNLLDLAAMSFLIGQGIGRWGNFANQEAFGRNTTLPWGMWSQETANYIDGHQAEFAARGIKAVAGTLADKAFVHPTFLYESLWCLISFGILYLICRKWRRFNGQLMLCYGVLYGAERFFVEGLRLDSLYLGGSHVRVSQLLSALLVIGCAAALVLLLLRDKKNHRPVEGVDFFPEAAAKAEKSEKIKKAAPARNGADPVLLDTAPIEDDDPAPDGTTEEKED